FQIVERRGKESTFSRPSSGWRLMRPSRTRARSKMLLLHNCAQVQDTTAMKKSRVEPDSKLRFDKYDPDDTGKYEKTDKGKDKARTITSELTAKLQSLQERLYANADRSLLIVLQGMDTSGKD